jgi:hypothetical protein
MSPRLTPLPVHTLLLLGLLLLPTWPSPAAGQSLEYGIPAMELRLELLPDGRMQIEERIEFRAAEAGGVSGGADDDATTLARVLPLYLLLSHSTSGAAAGSAGSTPGLGGAGMGASGGFGGGGGAIR